MAARHAPPCQTSPSDRLSIFGPAAPGLLTGVTELSVIFHLNCQSVHARRRILLRHHSVLVLAGTSLNAKRRLLRAVGDTHAEPRGEALATGAAELLRMHPAVPAGCGWRRNACRRRLRYCGAQRWPRGGTGRASALGAHGRHCALCASTLRSVRARPSPRMCSVCRADTLEGRWAAVTAMRAAQPALSDSSLVMERVLLQRHVHRLGHV